MAQIVSCAVQDFSLAESTDFFWSLRPDSTDLQPIRLVEVVASARTAHNGKPILFSIRGASAYGATAETQPPAQYDDSIVDGPFDALFRDNSSAVTWSRYGPTFYLPHGSPRVWRPPRRGGALLSIVTSDEWIFYFSNPVNNPPAEICLTVVWDGD